MIQKNQHVISMIEMLEELGYSVRRKPVGAQPVIDTRAVDPETYNKWKDRIYSDIDAEMLAVTKKINDEQRNLNNYNVQFWKIYQQFQSDNKPKYVDIIIKNDKIDQLRKELAALDEVVKRKIRAEFERKFKEVITEREDLSFQEYQTDTGLRFGVTLKDKFIVKKDYEFKSETELVKEKSEEQPLPEYKEEIVPTANSETVTITEEPTTVKDIPTNIPDEVKSETPVPEEKIASLRIGDETKEVKRADPKDPDTQVDTLAELTDEDSEGLFNKPVEMSNKVDEIGPEKIE